MVVVLLVVVRGGVCGAVRFARVGAASVRSGAHGARVQNYPTRPPTDAPPLSADQQLTNRLPNCLLWSHGASLSLLRSFRPTPKLSSKSLSPHLAFGSSSGCVGQLTHG